MSIQSDIAEYAYREMNEWQLIEQGWKFAFNRSKRIRGLCNYKKKTIYFSKHHTHIAESDWKNTILHEIAHALTPGHGHDKVWKRACVNVGARPERCYGKVPEKIQQTAKYLLVDFQGNVWFRYYRKPKKVTINAIINGKLHISNRLDLRGQLRLVCNDKKQTIVAGPYAELANAACRN